MHTSSDRQMFMSSLGLISVFKLVKNQMSRLYCQHNLCLNLWFLIYRIGEWKPPVFWSIAEYILRKDVFELNFKNLYFHYHQVVISSSFKVWYLKNRCFIHYQEYILELWHWRMELKWWWRIKLTPSNQQRHF